MTQVKSQSNSMVSAIQRCVNCELPTDRAWKTYIDKQYGQVWSERGICRHCWNASVARSLQNAQADLSALDYRSGN
jgi:hypothetical protein